MYTHTYAQRDTRLLTCTAEDSMTMGGLPRTWPVATLVPNRPTMLTKPLLSLPLDCEPTTDTALRSEEPAVTDSGTPLPSHDAITADVAFTAADWVAADT